MCAGSCWSALCNASDAYSGANYYGKTSGKTHFELLMSVAIRVCHDRASTLRERVETKPPSILTAALDRIAATPYYNQQQN